MVGWLSGFRAQTGSVANWNYATFVRGLGEDAAPGEGECGPYPDFAICTLAFALQLRKNHGKISGRASEMCWSGSFFIIYALWWHGRVTCDIPDTVESG